VRSQLSAAAFPSQSEPLEVNGRGEQICDFHIQIRSNNFISKSNPKTYCIKIKILIKSKVLPLLFRLYVIQLEEIKNKN